MRDIHVWERLLRVTGSPHEDDEADEATGPTSEAPSLDELVALLRRLARVPLERRACFLGQIHRLVDHEEIRVRAAAISALSGATGIEGLRSIVAALDDDAAEVREAALASLARSAKEPQQLRWAHALFHPRVDVRRAALERVPAGCAELVGYLRADPVCGELARAHGGLRDSLPLVIALRRRGLASDAELVEILGGVEVTLLEHMFAHGARRSPAQLDAAQRWLLAGGAEEDPSFGHDALDELVEAVSRVAMNQAGSHEALAVLEKLARKRSFTRRMTVAVGLAAACERCSQPLFDRAAYVAPALLGAATISLHRRRAAALACAPGAGWAKTNQAIAERLLDSELVAGPEGALSLEHAASIACLLDAHPLEGLKKRFGQEVIEARLAGGEVRGFAVLCRYAPNRLRTHLQAEDLIDSAPEPRRPQLRAAALVTWIKPQRKRALGLVDALGSAEIAAVTLALVEIVLAHPDRFELDDKGAGRLSELLSEAIPVAERAGVARELLTRLLEPHELGLRLLTRLLRELPQPSLALLVASTKAKHLRRLGEWMHELVLLPHEVERALVEQMRRHEDVSIRDAVMGLAGAVVEAHQRPTITTTRPLSGEELEAIHTASLGGLERALAPALAGPSIGLCGALAMRADPHPPNLAACLALLASHDHLHEIAPTFERFVDHEAPDFLPTLDGAAVTMWSHNPALPVVGHAWLHGFEQHGRAFFEWVEGFAGGLLEVLDRCASLACPTLRVRFAEALASTVQLIRYREPRRLERLVWTGLAPRLVAQLDTELGPAAAKLLVSMHLQNLCVRELDGQRQTVMMMAPDLDQRTRHELHRWLQIDGLPTRSEGARAERVAVRGDLLELLRTSEDLDQLADACLSPNRAVVHEAVLRLLELGEEGEQRLVLLLAEDSLPARVDVIVTSVALWRSAACIDDVRELAADPSVDTELRFRLALALAERGEREQVEVAIACARVPAKYAWFRPRDWKALLAFASASALAFDLADSPHPHAYQRALAWLLDRPSADRTVVPALRAFLATGTERPSHLRVKAARRLVRHLDISGLPVLIAATIDPRRDKPDLRWPLRLDGAARAQIVDAVVSAALVGGREACRERRVAAFLMLGDLPRGSTRAREAVDAGLSRLLLEASDSLTREQIARRCTSPSWRREALRGLGEIFAWGVRRGRELSGRLFRIHMTERREDYGFTDTREDRIFVSPLPYLAKVRHGRAIVEALILHEYGHHIHHSGEEAEKIWKRAQSRGLHGVLNLVADEHLERNLRSFRADYGDRLKRLAAYAFGHAERDIPWTWLLDQLGVLSFEVLAARPLAPAHARGELRVSRGDLLAALEAAGSSWARFARALRMGLGNRSGDPRVARGLALFKGRFRHGSMDELWQVTQALAEIFADELPLSHVCGGHETLGETEREGLAARRDLGEEELQDEVERILDPRQLGPSEGRDKFPRGKLAINVGHDERFDPIDHVERVSRDAVAHRKVAREVRRHADRLRAYLCELGLALVPRRARLRGRGFDRTRTQAVVLRRDPRMLVARELEVHSDLFIGVLVDCSGSMSIRDHLDKARHFAVLIAEAVRGLAGVEARFFGFTDSTIFDAGDADRCAVTSLETMGGNNDAAALYHAAQVALGSRRRAKLLVMISDGLPTECSAAALRNLVLQLSRRQQIICAQVAVRPLEEVCFPHYVSLHHESIEGATVRFGELVSKLARRALGR